MQPATSVSARGAQLPSSCKRGHGRTRRLRLIEDQNFRVVQKSGSDQNPLLHPFRISGDGDPARVSQSEKLQKFVGFGIDAIGGQSAKPARELKILEPCQVPVEVRLFGNIPDPLLESGGILADVAPVEQDLTFRWVQKPGQHLDGG